MKKSLLLMMACVVASASAQYSNFSENSRFGDDWSLGIEGGVQINLNTWKNSSGGIFGVNLNKDLTPYFGISLEALLGGDNNANWFSEPTYYKNGNGLDNASGFLTGRWNIFNTIGGFKGHRRVFEIETNVGAGYGRFYARKSEINHWNAFQVKTGLNMNFYVDEDRSFAINIRPACIWNLSETGKFDSRYAVAQLAVGLTYHFNTSNGTHFFVKSDASNLRDELASLTAINSALQAQLEAASVNQGSVVETVVEKVVEEVEVPSYVDNTYIVNFALDSAELVGDAKAILDKIPAGSSVEVAGYASPEGSKNYNLKLSDRRADVVKAYLESRGVKVTKAVGYGADNAESNRLVIVTLK